jgi:hypothetical protein
VPIRLLELEWVPPPYTVALIGQLDTDIVILSSCKQDRQDEKIRYTSLGRILVHGQRLWFRESNGLRNRD